MSSNPNNVFTPGTREFQDAMKSLVEELNFSKQELKAYTGSSNLNTILMNQNLKEAEFSSYRIDSANTQSAYMRGLESFRDLSPASRRITSEDDFRDRYFQAETPLSQVFQSQFLQSTGKESIQQLSNQELDSFIQNFEKFNRALREGNRNVQILSDNFPETMQGVSRALDRQKQPSLWEEMGKIGSSGGGVLTGAFMVGRGLESGNLLQTYQGGKTIVKGATSAAEAVGTFAANNAGAGGMMGGAANIAGLLASGPLAPVLAGIALLGGTMMAGTNISEKEMAKAANPSLQAGQLSTMLGGGSVIAGETTLGMGSGGNVDYAKAIENIYLKSGATISAEQGLGVLSSIAGRTDITGSTGTSLQGLLGQYGSTGLGADTFSDAVNKFSRIADDSNLVTAVRGVSEIVSRDGGVANSETVRQMQTLTESRMYGRGIRPGDSPTEVMSGIRGSMSYLEGLGIRGTANQLDTLRGVQGGLQNLGQTEVGRSLLFTATEGDWAATLDPSQIMDNPEQLERVRDYIANIGSQFGGDERTQRAAQRFHLKQMGFNDEFAQLILSKGSGGAPVSAEGINIGERDAKTRSSAGTAFETKMFTETEQMRTHLQAINENIADLVKGKTLVAETIKRGALTITDATINITTGRVFNSGSSATKVN